MKSARSLYKYVEDSLGSDSVVVDIGAYDGSYSALNQLWT